MKAIKVSEKPKSTFFVIQTFHKGNCGVCNPKKVE